MDARRVYPHTRDANYPPQKVEEFAYFARAWVTRTGVQSPEIAEVSGDVDGMTVMVTSVKMGMIKKLAPGARGRAAGGGLARQRGESRLMICSATERRSDPTMSGAGASG